jgi:hypothetical protein
MRHCPRDVLVLIIMIRAGPQSGHHHPRGLTFPRTPSFVTNADFDRGTNKLAAESALAVDIDGYLVVVDRDLDIDQGSALTAPASEPAMPSSEPTAPFLKPAQYDSSSG